jgi:hypothetical protein
MTLKKVSLIGRLLSACKKLTFVRSIRLFDRPPGMARERRAKPSSLARRSIDRFTGRAPTTYGSWRAAVATLAALWHVSCVCRERSAPSDNPVKREFFLKSLPAFNSCSRDERPGNAKTGRLR